LRRAPLGLASQWPRVTDNSGYGISGLRDGDGHGTPVVLCITCNHPVCTRSCDSTTARDFMWSSPSNCASSVRSSGKWRSQEWRGHGASRIWQKL